MRGVKNLLESLISSIANPNANNTRTNLGASENLSLLKFKKR